MSSPDLGRRRLVAASVLLGAAALAGCQVRPLYATPGLSSGPGGTVEPLSAIAIEPLRDRLGQSLVNELIFALRGGAALADAPRYRLRLIVTSRKSELGIQEFEDVPRSYLIALTASYTLTETATGRVLTTGTANTTASYDFSSQRFSNLRAERDAEDRAAKSAAEDIRTRLAAVLAAGG